jgi:hypothetical protein
MNKLSCFDELNVLWMAGGFSWSMEVPHECFNADAFLKNTFIPSSIQLKKKIV